LISVIACLCNPPALTANFLRRIQELRQHENFETVVVVDGDHDSRTRSLLRGAKGRIPGLRIEFRSQPGGYSAASNHAVAKAKGSTLVFVDSDTFPEPGAITALARHIHAQDSIGVVQGLLLYPQTLRVQSTGHIFGPYFNRHALCGRRANLPIVQVAADRQALTSAFYAVRRRLFEDHGGFDEFYWNSHEAMELALRIHLAGYRCVYRPEAIAYHVQGGSRRHIHLDERQQAAHFWSVWGRLAKSDLDRLLGQQLTPSQAKRKYLLINTSVNRAWRETLEGLPLRFSEVAEIQSSGQALVLHDTLVPELHRQKSPLLFLSDHFAHIAANLAWFRGRPTQDDLILDCHGNLVTVAEVLG